ncbi:amidohydrolase family protein, partial [Pseudonocardia sp. ICBG601]|uniref:amidohydrolase family protein n=1 Tax=Pseudonocardia sp. ICBG601 TaxID=2846759 RepID=UPI0021F546BA
MRSQLLDPYDVVAGVLIPMQGHTAGAEEPAFAAALCRAYNDVLVTDWLDPEPRLRASICIPHESPAEAVAEIERRADDPRFVQVLFPSGTFLPWSDPKYRPIPPRAAAHGLPVAIHLGGTEGHRGDGWPSFYLEQHAWYGNAVAVALTGLVAGGVLDAVPDLQFVLVEGGVSWLPSLLWGLDDAWELCRDDVPWLTRPPSEIVRERVWFTTQPIDEPPVPAHLATTWEQTGMTDRILFSSDYPHWDFDDPITALRVLPAALRRPMAAANAARLYGLTLTGARNERRAGRGVLRRRHPRRTGLDRRPLAAAEPLLARLRPGGRAARGPRPGRCLPARDGRGPRSTRRGDPARRRPRPPGPRWRTGHHGDPDLHHRVRRQPQPRVRGRLCRAVNTWVAQRFLDHEPRAAGRSPCRSVTRRRPSPRSSTGRTTRASCRCCSRCAATTCAGVTRCSGRSSPRAAAAGLVVTLHAWGGSAAPRPRPGSPTPTCRTTCPTGRSRSPQLVSLVAEGALGALPGLRVTVAECGRPGCRRCCGGWTRSG